MTNKYSEEGTQGSKKITLTDFTDDDVHDCDHVNHGVDAMIVMKILQRAVICSAVRRNKP